MGTVKLKFKEYIDSIGVTRYKVAKDCDIYYPTIDRYYKNKPLKYDSYILAKICDCLDCKIEDILEYVKD